MKVEYKCTYERVNEIIDKALDDDREIDHIWLAAGEWFAFHKKLCRMNVFTYCNEPRFVYRGTTIMNGGLK